MTWKVWAADDELAFEFIDGDRHIMVSLEKTQDRIQFGYAIRRGNHFDPGKSDLDDPEGVAAEINAALSGS